MMLDLLLWSCLLALTPWALGLACKLISGVAGLINLAAPNGSASLRAGAFLIKKEYLNHILTSRSRKDSRE
jgi:hypothetical protein